ncbi:MAG: hypothetical protein NT170_04500 [Candidatus Moranbacteria bacterium]|nr:hypothetical protein [Candidatus Moranbacteria bacterium]
MKKTKKSILAGIAIFAMVAIVSPVMAQPSGDQQPPPENDPFWTIFAQIDYPGNTTDCITEATNYVNSQNIPDENQRQGEISGYTEMCTQVANMPDDLRSILSSEGVTSNLFDNTTDWHNVDNLYFEKTGMGKIQFTNTIDFMSYRFISFMGNFDNMVQFNNGYISLNASIVTDMKYYGAQLTMLGLNFTDMPDIYVTDANGTTMHLATGSDINGATYDQTTGTLTFNTLHFSAFKAVAKGSKVAVMKITKVTPNKVKYSAKKRIFKITVKGKGFYKKGSDTSCKMGLQEASKVKV